VSARRRLRKSPSLLRSITPKRATLRPGCRCEPRTCGPGSRRCGSTWCSGGQAGEIVGGERVQSRRRGEHVLRQGYRPGSPHPAEPESRNGGPVRPGPKAGETSGALFSGYYLRRPSRASISVGKVTVGEVASGAGQSAR
jgi:hypothetical protein